MMIAENCATGTLAPYQPSSSAPWDRSRAQHLFRRLGFGAAPETLEQALSQNPAALVDELLGQAAALPLPGPPEWSGWSTDDYDDFNEQRIEQYLEWTVQWLGRMHEYGFREKLALFWHSHFATRFDTYLCPSYLYQYTTLLRQHALGNFKAFTHEMGRTPAMLIFLNGVQNTRFDANENYARELYELFTLGLDNGYTQQDIAETARALTGWNGINSPPFCNPITFVPLLFDNTPKTIFGQTGNWGYDDVHDLLFAERGEQVAQHICTKIYQAFVHPEAQQDIVSGLAQTFLNHDFELEPVFRQLFKSEHFFDEAVIGTQIKSPVELMLGMLRESRLPVSPQRLQVTGFLSAELGQQLFAPPDVKGWIGNRDWIDTNALTGRWQSLDYFIFQAYQFHPQVLVQLAKDLSSNSIDPYEVTHAVVGHFISGGLGEPADYERAAAVFKWEVPQNYYDAGEWNLNWDTVPAQMAFLLRHIARLPEFQLS
ncbi:DUF1800 domain-containing protein [Phaeodactylibacter luteus]|uniref:DUF1800 domain-containing protein n=1 Tax=Phaeodactylibacter luteus TaxID=1564516 RepID=A0A5C6RP85_9BACT|nr:DUF1800 domain-containing protein [Phaeodactylibacter luteus]TXB63202.1 DUF1800 domain-containing protein [Phaeodactylibacter luteus]